MVIDVVEVELVMMEDELEYQKMVNFEFVRESRLVNSIFVQDQFS